MLPGLMPALIGLRLGPARLLVTPDVGRVKVTILIRNDSAIVDRYTIAVAGLGEGWWRLSPGAAAAHPGEECSVVLEITPPDRQPSNAYPFRVTVTSVSTPAESAYLDSVLDIQGEAAPRSRTVPERARGLRGRFSVQTQNLGTQDLLMRYEAYDTEQACRFTFRPVEQGVPVGEIGTTRLSVKPHRNSLFGEPYIYYLRVTPIPRDHPELREELDLEFEHVPLFRSIWTLVLLMFLAALVFAAVLAVDAAGGPDKAIDYLTHDLPDDLRNLLEEVRG